MPRPSTWIGRVPVILKALENAAAERYTREEVEQLFAVSPSRAKTIMAVAGGKNTKAGLSIGRQKLLDYVKFSHEASEYRASEERRAELAEKLQNAEKEERLKRRPIPEARREEWPLLRDVMPKFTFQPGAVTIAHNGFPDLLHTLWLLGQALGPVGAYEQFQELVEGKKKMRTGA